MTQQIPVYLQFGSLTKFTDLPIGQIFIFEFDKDNSHGLEDSFVEYGVITNTFYLDITIWVKTESNVVVSEYGSMELEDNKTHAWHLTSKCFPLSFCLLRDTYTFDKYNEQCKKTKQDWSNYSSTEIDYCIIAMLGELGEFANKYKKLVRGDYQNLRESYSVLLDELGDVLWYFNQLVQLFGSSLAIVAMRNVAKLIKRKEQGTIHNTLDREE